MFFRFGSYDHPANEVNLTSFEVIPRHSERGRPMTKLIRLHLNGEIIVDSTLTTSAARQADLNTKIARLIDTYSQQNMDQNCGLYHDNETVTRHKLESSTTNPANISGVRLAYRSWPKGDPAEYATCRSFYIILEAEYRDLESQIVAYHERVHGIGTTGPEYAWTTLAQGLPTRQILAERTVQEVVQEGSVTGFDGWPAAFLYGSGPLFPTLEDLNLRQIVRTGPSYVGRAFTHYRIDWRYVFRSNVDTDAYPRIF